MNQYTKNQLKENQAQVNQPVAIILAGQPLENDLREIFGKRETASLMIAGTLLIEHVLRELQDLNFSQCIILARENAHEIYTLVSASKHLAMKVEVMNYALSKDELLREFKPLSQPNGLLLVEANKLRSQSVEQFLDKCKHTNYLLYDATFKGQELGLTYLKPSNADFIINAKHIELTRVTVNSLQGTRDFHKANMDLVLGKYAGLESGVSCHLVGTQLRHWSAEVDPRSNIADVGVMIDRKCRIERNVRLNSVVLNRGVYVEQNTRLQNTIVMPNAVIPANQTICNAIVQGEVIYRLFE